VVEADVPNASTIIDATALTVTASILLHGLTAGPLTGRYVRGLRRREPRGIEAAETHVHVPVGAASGPWGRSAEPERARPFVAAPHHHALRLDLSYAAGRRSAIRVPVRRSTRNGCGRLTSDGLTWRASNSPSGRTDSSRQGYAVSPDLAQASKRVVPSVSAATPATGPVVRVADQLGAHDDAERFGAELWM
jgi:NhaP-type Na+/H+ or K+/H+ antiporter